VLFFLGLESQKTHLKIPAIAGVGPIVPIGAKIGKMAFDDLRVQKTMETGNSRAVAAEQALSVFPQCTISPGSSIRNRGSLVDICDGILI
jgi:hypothetical protein